MPRRSSRYCIKKKYIVYKTKKGMDNEDTIDNKYIIKGKKGKGASATVFRVEERTNKKIYASKVFKEDKNLLFNKEIQILNVLKNKNIPYIINIVDSGIWTIIRIDKPTETRQYIVLEYAPKGEIYNYIYFSQSGLEEKYAKVIFLKILEGVQACHNANICHRDLKLQNILFDEQFNPKICDFGLAAFNKEDLKDFLGTPSHVAPEILLNRKYNGFKADIFSLGVVLFNLVTGKPGFLKANTDDYYYILIMLNKYEEYWSALLGQIQGLSDEFKQLYFKMVSFIPKYRPSIKDILKDPWFKEIRDLNNEQLTQLENEIREELLKREEKIQEELKTEMNIEDQSNISNINGNRGGDDEKKYFELNLIPKFCQTGIGMNNYIKIKGELNPVQFMNSLANKLEKEFGKYCDINPAENSLKFDILIQEKEKEEIPKELEEELAKLGLENVEENDDNLLKKDCIIQVKLFEYFEGGHLLRFMKKSGELEDYYKNVKKVMSLIKNSFSDNY